MTNEFPRAPGQQAASLPVYTQAQGLIDAVRHHQVVIVEGPTGCGKTTQIPQILLRAGLVNGWVGVTQPRRIAAVSVAARIAEEQSVSLGAEVGYTIRFDDCTSPQTRVQIMTDGILLQEARKDPDFSRYGLLIIDEAHERTLNIDFLLGLLCDVLPRRPDLRVIVSSATLQPGKFVDFFREHVLGATVPVVQIDARPFAVTMVYHPVHAEQAEQLADAVAGEVMQVHRSRQPGHVLCFLPGEDAIKRTVTNLERLHLKDMLVLPLYGALKREDQERVFLPAPGQRKVIIATNIAETSITIDDTRFVIDSGLAKVPRMAGAGLTVLREEGISQASADQRAGRAGRTAPGTCIRLYTQESYRRRPRFTDEEVLRLDLSEVVLRLCDLGLRDVERFPLPTPAPLRRLHAALQSLQEMGALDAERKLTEIGRLMVPYPLSPQLARMVVEAGKSSPDVLLEVLMIAALQSTRSPILYPPGREDEARRSQARMAHPLGDAMTAVHLVRSWQHAEDREAFCRKTFLDPAAMNFIDSAYHQLADISLRLGLGDGSGGEAVAAVRCVVAGFQANLLCSRGRWFEGAGGDDRIFVHPSSALYNVQTRFAVAMEIVIGTRAYARQVSLVRPAWVLEFRPDLAERWGLRGERAVQEHGAKEHGQALAIQPKTLQLGDLELPVQGGKHKGRIELPAELLQQLQSVDIQALPASAKGLQARIVQNAVDGERVFAQGTPLAALLAMLPVLPIPAPDADLRCTVPEGALLELDINQHTLQRFLPSLLKPMRPMHGKRPGWVMLVGNGGGGYWYEVGPDFREVVETTAISLEDLQQNLPEGDALHPDVAVQIARLAELVQRMHAGKAKRN